MTLSEHASEWGTESKAAGLPFRYGVYGIALRSEIPLSLPEPPDSALAEIELRTASAEWFADATQGAEIHRSLHSWYRYAQLLDRSNYARWDGVGEFLVSSDGKLIVCRQSNRASGESFQVYLLAQALSFALVKQGFEPLHATSVVVEREAIVFLGDGGFGKSTLAAGFLSAGYRILTDDLLILRKVSNAVVAYPGPTRIKLYPHVAEKLLAEVPSGITMNLFTKKIILPLSSTRVCPTPVPLRAIYSVAAPREGSRNENISIEPLSARESFVELVTNTFNHRIVDAERLKRQFIEIAHLVAAARVRKLIYPRALDHLTEVCNAIVTDLHGLAEGAA